MKAHKNLWQPDSLPLLRLDSMPTQERVVDRLADLMLGADDVLEMLRARDSAHIRWIEPDVQSVYEKINDLMKRLCD